MVVSIHICRIGKVDSALCPFCEIEDDSPDHTIQRCEKWGDERELLSSVIGPDLSLDTIVQKILESVEN